MIKDPIVDEIKKYREDYVKKLDNDSVKILKDLRAKQETLKKQGWKFAKGEPRIYKKEAA